MKKYDFKKAERLTQEFRKRTNIDLKNESRNKDEVSKRALFYKVLTEFNNMKYPMISDFLKEAFGIKKDRGSIRSALNKIDTYYLSCDNFRAIYDDYFSDRANISEKEELILMKKSDENERLNRLNIRRSMTKYERLRMDLDSLILTIPDERINEIIQHLELRVKSWSWKSNADKCKVFSCSESLSDYNF